MMKEATCVGFRTHLFGYSATVEHTADWVTSSLKMYDLRRAMARSNDQAHHLYARDKTHIDGKKLDTLVDLHLTKKCFHHQ